MHRAGTDERDVLIVGAGPVGLLLAHCLGRSGLSVTILEKNAALVDIPRAIAIDDESLRTLDALGLFDSLADRIAFDLPVRFLSGSGKTLISMSNIAREYGFPAINSFYQPDLEASLLASLDAFPNVEVRFEEEATALDQDATGINLTAVSAGSERSYRARYAVGCDGGRSFVRRSLGIAMSGSTHTQRWLILDTGGDHLDRRDVTFFCDPERPAVSIFRVAGRRRWEFMLRPDERDEDLLDPAFIRGLLARKGASPDRIERKTVYGFHSLLADRMQRGRVFLAGDAAHLSPPFAGQGLNGGIRDVVNLSWRLSLLVAGAPAELADGYEGERRHHVKAMTRLADMLGQVIMTSGRGKVKARDLAFGLLNASRAARNFLDRGGIRPEPRLPAGLLMERRLGSNATGRAIRRPDVRTADGRTLPLDHHLGPSFAIVAHGTEIPRKAVLSRTAWSQLPAVRLAVLEDENGWGAVPDGWVGIIDPSGLLRKAFDGRKAALIRPDRYIARCFRAEEAADVGRWFDAAVGKSWSGHARQARDRPTERAGTDGARS